MASDQESIIVARLQVVRMMTEAEDVGHALALHRIDQHAS